MYHLNRRLLRFLASSQLLAKLHWWLLLATFQHQPQCCFHRLPVFQASQVASRAMTSAWSGHPCYACAAKVCGGWREDRRTLFVDWRSCFSRLHCWVCYGIFFSAPNKSRFRGGLWLEFWRNKPNNGTISNLCLGITAPLNQNHEWNTILSILVYRDLQPFYFCA